MTDTTNTEPPLPADIGMLRFLTSREYQAIRNYGLQCFEAGRQQGMLPTPSKLDRECLRLGQEIHRAAGELPPGWNIEIDVERGAGSVTLIDPECERTYFNDMVDGMSHALSAAIAAANEPPKA